MLLMIVMDIAVSTWLMSSHTGQSPTCSIVSKLLEWLVAQQLTTCLPASRPAVDVSCPSLDWDRRAWRSLVTFFWHSSPAIWLWCHCSTCLQRLTPSTTTRCFDGCRHPTASTMSSSNGSRHTWVAGCSTCEHRPPHLCHHLSRMESLKDQS